MKRLFGPLFLILFSVFGAGLLFQKSQSGVPPKVIQITSDRAILKLDHEWEAGLLDGSIKISLPWPDAKVLIRMDAENPLKLAMKLNESVEGQPFVVINSKSRGRGIIELPKSQSDSTSEAVELSDHDGNVYALAIRNEGSLKATAKPKFIPIPPKLSESVKIKD